MSIIGTEVWIGDKKIPNVKTVGFKHEAGEIPRVLLEIYPMDGLEIEGTADVLKILPEPEQKTT